MVRATLLPWLGYAAPRPTYGFLVQLLDGAGQLLWALIYASLGGIQGALTTVLLVVLLRFALRWNWLSLGVTAIMLSVGPLRLHGRQRESDLLSFRS